ncbi:phosphogluconate dehydratase [Sesbania bispinosa]|nr:phosphogluconate dehydratase [Sesbania bispinosa]
MTTLPRWVEDDSDCACAFNSNVDRAHVRRQDGLSIVTGRCVDYGMDEDAGLRDGGDATMRRWRLEGTVEGGIVIWWLDTVRIMDPGMRDCMWPRLEMRRRG